MKKLTLIAIAATIVAFGVQGQGLVNFANSANAGTQISVNSVIGGGPNAKTPAVAGSLYYALFYSTSSALVEGSAASLIPTLGNNQAGNWVWNDPNWNFAGGGAPSYTVNGTPFVSSGYAQNTGLGRLLGLIPDAVGGLAAGGTATFAVVGWSSTMGTTWQAVQTFLTTGNVVGNMYLGESAVSVPLGTGDNFLALTPSIFGAAGATPGFTLGLLNPVPEPTTMALAGLAGLSLLLFRRRK